MCLIGQFFMSVVDGCRRPSSPYRKAPRQSVLFKDETVLSFVLLTRSWTGRATGLADYFSVPSGPGALSGPLLDYQEPRRDRTAICSPSETTNGQDSRLWAGRRGRSIIALKITVL